MVGFLYSATRLLSVGLLILTVSVLAGCKSGDSDKFGNVQGKVKVDGAPANSGTVVFTVNGSSVSGPIDPDGSYRVIQVPVGSAQISVNPVSGPAGASMPAAAPMKDMPGMGTASKPVPIPARYGKGATSGLTFVVKGGANTNNIDLAK